MKRLLELCNRLKSCLRYQGLSTEAILRRLIETEDAAEQRMFLQCLEALEHGVPFPKAWETAVGEAVRHSEQPDDLLPLSRLSGVIGASDVTGQLRGIELVEEELRLRYEEAVNAQKTKGRLYRSLGGLLGAGIVVLLL